MNAARFLTIACATLGLLVTVAPTACSDDPPASSKKNRDGGGGDDDDGGSTDPSELTKNGICLLNNCDLDRHCRDCTDGQTVCLQAEHRCVACGPAAGGKGCDAGKSCTKYGNCVANGVVCAEDAQGVPTITCKNDADCGACSPKFRVCDEAAGKCVACKPGNVSNCQSTDKCTTTGSCAANCPATCNADADCETCGTRQKPAAACNNHKCAECSATKECPNGGRCDVVHGTCIAQCGTGERDGVSSCADKGNCAACTGTNECKIPVGGGEGVCAAKATGCEDLGKGTIVLPDPFSRVTQTCSTDANCSGQGIDINVGKILRDVTGLGFFKDGNLKYSLNACASVELFDKSCGLCVPCKKDTDCTDISIDDVAGSVLGPLGEIGSAILLDKAFGPNDHKIHMYCQNVAGNYGVCAPCSNVLSRCAEVSESEITDLGKCDHDICEQGTALGLRCGAPSTCVAEVCKKDPFCCTKEWDFQCKQDVDLYCKDKTCQPDNCAFRKTGWYCNADKKGGYRCIGDGTQTETNIAEGSQCANNAECHTEKQGPKEPAILCTTESDTDAQCPLGTKDKPKCFRQ